MHELARNAGAEFLLVYLPCGAEFDRDAPQTLGEQFFERYVQDRGVQGLNLKPDLLAAPFEKTRKHYGPNENAVVSATVMRRIEALDSWKVMTGRDR